MEGFTINDTALLDGLFLGGVNQEHGDVDLLNLTTSSTVMILDAGKEDFLTNRPSQDTFEFAGETNSTFDLLGKAVKLDATLTFNFTVLDKEGNPYPPQP